MRPMDVVWRFSYGVGLLSVGLGVVFALSLLVPVSSDTGQGIGDKIVSHITNVLPFFQVAFADDGGGDGSGDGGDGSGDGCCGDSGDGGSDGGGDGGTCCTPPPPVPLFCTITANPAHVEYGGSTTLTWTTSGARDASISGIGPVALSGSLVVSNLTADRTFVMTVTNIESVPTFTSGTRTVSYTCQVSVHVTPPPPPPYCTLTSAQNGYSHTLSWSSQNATSAYLNQGIGNVGVNGSMTVTVNVTTTYILTVTGPGGTAICETTITKVPPPNPPSCEIWSSQSGYGYKLVWTSTNATSASINQGIGNVSLNGEVSVSPTQTTTYTLTVMGAGGTAICDTTITKVPPPNPPSCEIWSAAHGEGYKLTWTSQNATSASINQGIGSVAVNGNMSVNPSMTTTYTLSVTGPGGTANCDTTITKVPPPNPPACTLTVDPTEVESGAEVVVSWTSTNATSVFFSGAQGGQVALNGSFSVFPTQTTIYEISAKNDAGDTVKCEVTVHVKHVEHVLSCDISANPSSIKKGQSSTLTWTSSGATTAVISSIGSVAVTGTHSVSPTASTMYTLTVSDGDGHSTSCSTSIEVKNKPSKKYVCYWVPEDVEEEWNDDNEFDTYMKNAYNGFMQSHGLGHSWNPEVTLQD